MTDHKSTSPDARASSIQKTATTLAHIIAGISRQMWRQSVRSVFGRIWFLAAALVISSGLVLSSILGFGLPVERIVVPAEIQAQTGSAYYAPANLDSPLPNILVIAGDSMAAPNRSNLMIIQDGQTIGPPHAQHFTIQTNGLGQFSHWGDTVIFSSSDGSDPRSNARQYVFRAQAVLSPVVFWSAAVVLFLSISAAFIRWREKVQRAANLTAFVLEADRTWLVLAGGLSTAVAAIWSALFWGHVLLTYDSATYTTNLFIVPLGYPLFLDLLEATPFGLEIVPLVQIFALCGAIFYASGGIRSLLRHKFLAWFVLLLTLGYVPPFFLAGYILSDTPLVILLLVCVGAGLHLINNFRPGHAFVFALTAALIPFVRPAGIYVPLGAIFFLMAWHGMTKSVLIRILLPMAVFIGITVAVDMIERGTDTAPQSGRVLFGHVSLLFDASLIDGPDAPFAEAVEAALVTYREEYQALESIDEKFVYSNNTYNLRLVAIEKTGLVREGETIEQLSHFIKERFIWLERIERDFAIATITQRPLEYARYIYVQLLGGWRTNIFTNWGPAGAWFRSQVIPFDDVSIEVATRAIPTLAPDTARFPEERLDTWIGAAIDAQSAILVDVRQNRLLIYATALITLIAMPIAVFFRRRSKVWLALGLLGVMIHGGTMLTAAVTAFIPRYAMPIDIILLLAFGFIVDSLLAWLIARFGNLKRRIILTT